MQIKIYTTLTCPWCNKLKEWLKENKYEFEELIITDESEYRDALLEKTGQIGIPVIEVGEKIIVGFNLEELKKAIKVC